MEQFKIILVIIFFNLFSQKSNLSEFQFTRLLNGKLSLVIPRRLNKVSDRQLLAKFPITEQRPTIVFENSKSNEKLSINYGSSFAEDKDLPMIASYFEKMYKPVSYLFINKGLKKVNRKPIGMLEFDILNKSTGEYMSNYLLLSTINKKLIIINYSFPAKNKAGGVPEAMMILNSIKINL